MNSRFSYRRLSRIVEQHLKMSAVIVLVAIITGSVTALFLWLLDMVTVFRTGHEWLLFLLPVAGIVIHFLYRLWGRRSTAGIHLILDEIKGNSKGIPAGMAPLVIFTTLITHVFGGSAGREGTAVQAGGSIAAAMGRLFRLLPQQMRLLLTAGMAAGFAAVFGTPLTGVIFAMEVTGYSCSGTMVSCLMAAFIADYACAAWGIHHTHYEIQPWSGAALLPNSTGSYGILLLKITGAGVAFGLAGAFFTNLMHRIKHISAKYISRKWLVPVAGGLLVLFLTWLLGTHSYLGLGVWPQDKDGVSLISAFHVNGVTSFSWLWKVLFTAVTLGTGFKGGEVTPLFFIGAALGNTIAVMAGVPVDLMAGLGFIAVFAAAANVPLAGTLMGIELFGVEYSVYYAVVCYTAWYCSGHKGIYTQ